MNLKTEVIEAGKPLVKPSNMAQATEIAAKIPVRSIVGTFVTMADMMQFAQLMAGGGSMVGAAFRNKPGACLGIITQAARLNMDPFALSQKAYVIKETISYEAQAVISMVYASGIVDGRMRYTFEGEGQDRVCIVTVKFKGDPVSVVHRSPPYKQIQPKNSPLWKTDPDQQQSYYTARTMARLHAPDVLMGVYTCDEAESMHAPTTEGIKIDPKAMGKLPSKPTEAEPEQANDESEASNETTEDEIRSAFGEAMTLQELAVIYEELTEQGVAGDMFENLHTEYAETIKDAMAEVE